MTERPSNQTMMEKVAVVPHNPSWRARFEDESAKLAEVFGDLVVGIHHVGSTAIPGIFAKNIIDLLIEVDDVESVDGLNGKICSLGYQALGENGILGRRFFIKTNGVARTHHVHTFQSGHPEIEKMLNFRDYLRIHLPPAQIYSDLKRSLAVQFPADFIGYHNGKDPFIKDIIDRAAAWRSNTGTSS